MVQNLEFRFIYVGVLFIETINNRIRQLPRICLTNEVGHMAENKCIDDNLIVLLI